MEGVMVSTATGAMNSLLSKLFKLANMSYEFNLFRGIRKEIEFLKHELSYMNALLHKLANMEELDIQTHVWRNKVRELSYDIEDCIDIFMHHLGNNNDETAGLVHEATKMFKKLWVCHRVSKQIQQLKDRVVHENERRKRYKLDEGPSNSRVVEIDPRLPSLYAHDGLLVGVDGPRETIIHWLIEDGGRGSSQQLKILSIVGFGGLGKTTLANLVFCKIKDKFDCTAFVSVSQKPNLPKILKDILSAIGGFMGDPDDNLQTLIDKMREHLMYKRYQIIIDDLWSIPAWDTIKCAFVENNNGSGVITTTRIQDVATACCFPYHPHVYQMQCLDELYSRRLFFNKVFGTEDGCPDQFREISEDMLRKCKGVPLAITSITSLLANQSMHVETWERIRNSLGYELDTNPTLEWMRRVLNLSYNDLSYELKTCLLYLGAYPEDHAIGKFDLVRKWIAEGFIRQKHGLDLEEVAENYFNELVNRSMIQPFFDDSDEEWSCRVHDLMLDLIISKCSEENFTTIIDSQFKMNNGASQVRRISHQSNNSNIALVVDKMSLSQVRSYNSFPAVHCMPLLSKFEHFEGFGHRPRLICSARICMLCFICSKSPIPFEVPEVRGFRLELPEKFGKLEHLMTLDISRGKLCPSHQSSDFTSLSSLRHLSLSMFGHGVVLRNGLSKLCNLRTLFHFDVRTNSADCIRGLGELANLRELSVSYSRTFGVQDNPDTRLLKYDILAASLDKLGSSNLRDLDIVGCDSSATPTQFWDNCFTRPSNLQRLWLPKLSLPRVPNWMVPADRLENLKKLTVQ
ncbi:hypothetical protein C2845_PM05G18570 [Panicum miliaceum]|uniref:Disease resistance RPP13-like protein 3 n=1 Tax=Panicum miliaceum TaxID=4540 RepID=A0A3L6SYM2_PANMI|nr:hypothetical protein C2845_PM05G18570 [Panicum miliaceum]